ncbi:hypothetical protein [Hyphomonas sp.]|uniref:hypothetical protein n=1 Tax=Hyphomonas sp. TaxID=87 RepID=UPI0030F53466
MRRFAGVVPGVALLLIGSVKVWAHTQSLQAFLSVRCGPDGLSSANHAPAFWTTMFNGHCWGCPVAFSGALMILAAAALWAIPPTLIKSRAR